MKIKKKPLLRVVRVLLFAYIGFCIVLFALQRRMIYFPTEALDLRNDSLIAIDVGDAVLQISTRQRDNSPALIYFGGNAENVSYALPYFANAFPDHSIYMMHYRGYGASTGRPTEKALHSDARALYDMVRSRHGEIILVGRSLGSAVAVRLAAESPVERLVLVTPFDSILRIARKGFPFVPLRLLLLDKYESWRHAPAVEAPTLLIAASDDEVIPRENTLALLEAFRPGVARFILIDGADHNSLSECTEYMPAVVSGE